MLQAAEKRRGAIITEYCYGSSIILALHFSSLLHQLDLFSSYTEHNTFSFIHFILDTWHNTHCHSSSTIFASIYFCYSQHNTSVVQAHDYFFGCANNVVRLWCIAIYIYIYIYIHIYINFFYVSLFLVWGVFLFFLFFANIHKNMFFIFTQIVRTFFLI